jgi:HEAT repeat protein
MSQPAEKAGKILGSVAPIADSLEALGHDSPFERSEGGVPQDPVARDLAANVKDLLLLLKDPDPQIRLRAVTSLGAIGAEAHATLPALRSALKSAALKDGDETVRTAAVHGVIQIGPQASSQVAALIEALQDEIDAVRFHAALALGDCGAAAQPATANLVHCVLWDKDPAVRVEAAVALWKVDNSHSPIAIPALIEALSSDNELICWIAADCLGRMGPAAREAVPALQKALQRPFQMGLLRRGVALALERIGPPS